MMFYLKICAMLSILQNYTIFPPVGNIITPNYFIIQFGFPLVLHKFFF